MFTFYTTLTVTGLVVLIFYSSISILRQLIVSGEQKGRNEIDLFFFSSHVLCYGNYLKSAMIEID